MVVCLLPARTDTAWWHDFVMKAAEIRFIRGRVHFNDQGPAPFPSCVVVFHPLMSMALYPRARPANAHPITENAL